MLSLCFKFFAVFLGGGAGSALRWFISHMMCAKGQSPLFATFTVNIIGSFILGFAFYFLLNKMHIPDEARLLLTAGFCGGFTTFSTFALENTVLIGQGEIVKSIIYSILTVVFTILSAFIGVYLAKQL